MFNLTHHNILQSSGGKVRDSMQALYSPYAELEDVSNPETQNGLLPQVKGLAKNAANINKAFEWIQAGLKTLSNQDFQGENGMSIPKFQLAWIVFQKVGPQHSSDPDPANHVILKWWTALLWDSYQSATAIETYITGMFFVVPWT
jgi:hypothetical protein